MEQPTRDILFRLKIRGGAGFNASLFAYIFRGACLNKPNIDYATYSFGV
jgi:hypothetical protein